MIRIVYNKFSTKIKIRSYSVKYSSIWRYRLALHYTFDKSSKTIGMYGYRSKKTCDEDNWDSFFDDPVYDY